MYDHLTCEVELPGLTCGRTDFQTKSLDCNLDTYVIAADGTLWRETDRSSGVRVRVQQDGVILFYGYGEAGRRLEYTATFEAGRLVRLIPRSEPAA